VQSTNSLSSMQPSSNARESELDREIVLNHSL
jgi:hypothetical protein